MRTQTLVAEVGALLDAELVLFVDADQAEVGEVHALAQQRLRADGDVDLALARGRA